MKKHYGFAPACNSTITSNLTAVTDLLRFTAVKLTEVTEVPK